MLSAGNIHCITAQTGGIMKTCSVRDHLLGSNETLCCQSNRKYSDIPFIWCLNRGELMQWVEIGEEKRLTVNSTLQFSSEEHHTDCVYFDCLYTEQIFLEIEVEGESPAEQIRREKRTTTMWVSTVFLQYSAAEIYLQYLWLTRIIYYTSIFIQAWRWMTSRRYGTATVLHSVFF